MVLVLLRVEVRLSVDLLLGRSERSVARLLVELLKVLGDRVRDVVRVLVLLVGGNFVGLLLHLLGVRSGELDDLGLSVLDRVVGKVTLEDVNLPGGQVAAVDGDTVVILSSTGSDEGPVALLLPEVETGRVGDEDDSEEETEETEPGDDEEFGLGADVAGRRKRLRQSGKKNRTLVKKENTLVDDRREESPNLSCGSR